MNCISPPALEDWQLFKYLDGEADGDISYHLELCQFCRDKKDKLALFQDRLKSRLMCPSPMELGEYELNMLSKGRELVVVQHLRDCPYCESEVAQLRDFLSDLSLNRKGDLLTKAKVLVARLVGGQAGELSGLPTYTALRGENKGPLIFEVDGVVITLDVQPGSNGKASILGQVAADDQDRWTGAIVELQQSDLQLLTTSLDDLGAFSFEAVSPGSAQIIITSPQKIVVQIPKFDLSV